MASSGTVTTIVFDYKEKPRNRSGVFRMGRMRIKNTAVLEAGDLELRTIRSIVATPSAWAIRSGGPPMIIGSVNTPGSLMNAVTFYTLRGSIVPATGTQHVGTAAGGTMTISFFLLGE